MPTGQAPAAQTAESEEAKAERREAYQRVLFHLKRVHAERNADLDFHDLGHIDDVIEGVNAFFDTLGIDEDSKERQAAVLAAAGHDLVQRSLVVDGVRKRLGGFELSDIPEALASEARNATESINGKKVGGGNEALSALYTIELLESFDQKGVLDDEMKQLISDAIKVTVPDFQGMVAVDVPSSVDSQIAMVQRNQEGEPMGLMIEQKHLGPQASLTELSVAMADLFTVGRCTFEHFFETGNAEFREVQIAYDEKLHTALSDISATEKADMAAAMLNWWRSQISFALGQKQRFERVMQQSRALNQYSMQRQKIYDLFGKFDTNILAMDAECERLQQAYGELKNEAFYEQEPDADKVFQRLTLEMGYIQVMRD